MIARPMVASESSEWMEGACGANVMGSVRDRLNGRGRCMEVCGSRGRGEGARDTSGEGKSDRAALGDLSWCGEVARRWGFTELL